MGLGELPWLAKTFSHSIMKSAVELYIPQLVTDSDRLAIGECKKRHRPRSGCQKRLGANLELEDLASLPNTSTELQTIASVFDTELMLQASATEQNARSSFPQRSTDICNSWTREWRAEEFK